MTIYWMVIRMRAARVRRFGKRSVCPQVSRFRNGTKGGTSPPCFAKSGEVAWNQRVAEGLKIRVCRRLKRKGLRTCVNGRKRFAVRRGRSSSRTSIACGRVLVNDDLSDGNSNARGGCSVLRKRSVCPHVSTFPTSLDLSRSVYPEGS